MREPQPGPDDGRETSSLADLDARLRRAREAQQPRGVRTGAVGGATGLGLALRVGIELVAGVAVGAGIGVVLDRWLGTGPWLLIGFFFLGAAAGALNTYRAVGRMNAEPAETADDEDVR